MIRTRLRIAVSVAFGVVILFVGSLAFNVASSQATWPGPLDFVRRHAWLVLLALVPLAVLAAWPPRSPPGETSWLETRHQGQLTLWLPARNPRFVGRAGHLANLRKALTSRGAVTVQALHGMGGIGKTQLAVEYAYFHLTRYHFVAFIDAERPELIGPQFVALARELHLPDVAPQQAVAAVYRKLADFQPWLLIFDNGEKPADLIGVLPAGVAIGTGHVIVTSRRGGWASRGGVVNVDLFTREESITVLANRISNIPNAVADHICELLGDLPLAIEQAAAYMDTTGTPPAEYVDLITRHLESMLPQGEVADHATVAATLWNVSVRRLEAERPTGVDLLQLCAVLAPEPIPLNLFTANPEILGPALRKEAVDPAAWSGTVGAVIHLSLGRRNQDQIIVHRLVQAAIRAHMSQEEIESNRTLVLRLLAAHLPKNIEGEPRTWPQWQRLLAHVLTATEAQLPAPASEAGQLLSSAAHYLQTLGNPAAAMPLAQRALALDEAFHGPDHPQVGADLIILSRILQDLGDPAAALPLAQRALALDEAFHGPKHASVGVAAVSLSFLYWDVGNSAMALPLAERALLIFKALYGDEHPWIGVVLAMLALLRLAENNSAEALSLANRALAIHEAAHGVEHPWVGADLTVLALIHKKLGREGEAVRYAKRALVILEPTRGNEHRWTKEARAIVSSSSSR